MKTLWAAYPALRSYTVQEAAVVCRAGNGHPVEKKWRIGQNGYELEVQNDKEAFGTNLV